MRGQLPLIDRAVPVSRDGLPSEVWSMHPDLVGSRVVMRRLFVMLFCVAWVTMIAWAWLGSDIHGMPR